MLKCTLQNTLSAQRWELSKKDGGDFRVKLITDYDIRRFRMISYSYYYYSNARHGEAEETVFIRERRERENRSIHTFAMLEKRSPHPTNEMKRRKLMHNQSHAKRSMKRTRIGDWKNEIQFAHTLPFARSAADKSEKWDNAKGELKLVPPPKVNLRGSAN